MVAGTRDAGDRREDTTTASGCEAAVEERRWMLGQEMQEAGERISQLQIGINEAESEQWYQEADCGDGGGSGSDLDGEEV